MNKIPLRAAISLTLLASALTAASGRVDAQAQIVKPPRLTWATEIVDGQKDVGYSSHIAISGSDLHVVYFDNWNSALKYAKKTAAGWSVEQIAKASGTAAGIAVDPAGNPHVSFVVASGGTYTLRHAAKIGGQWTVSNVDQVAGLLIGESSIVVAANNSVHISYRYGTQLKYAVNPTGSGTWSSMVVDGGAPLNKVTGRWSSIALDPAGRPCISYFNVTDSDLMFAQWTGSAWRRDIADFIGSVGTFTSLAMDAGGRPHIAYYDDSGMRIKYTTWGAGGVGDWLRNPTFGEIVDPTGRGAGSSIVLDRSGVPHIAYQGGAGPAFELRFATRTGPNAWRFEAIEGGGAGSGASVAYDAAGLPHISYAFIAPSSAPTAILKHATLVPVALPIFTRQRP
ncbi:MAG TPA: hypothetical protein VGE96_07535 [Steroidobacteraceae bacterium]|jgi:hypothetical protein